MRDKAKEPNVYWAGDNSGATCDVASCTNDSHSTFHHSVTDEKIRLCHEHLDIDPDTVKDLAPNGKPKVTISEIGYGENPALTLGRAQKAMSRAGWTQEEIHAFLEEVTEGKDYYECLNAIEQYVKEED